MSVTIVPNSGLFGAEFKIAVAAAAPALPARSGSVVAVSGRTPSVGKMMEADQAPPASITVVDKTHPITQGVDDFDLIDETYLCPILEDSVHPLLKTDFVPTEDKFSHAPNGAHVGPGHPPGSQLTGWYKAAENTPIVYLQHGHDNNAWSNPSFKRLMLNAIKWAASPEAKSWARTNSKRIFV